jgi:hypothetical protein
MTRTLQTNGPCSIASTLPHNNNYTYIRIISYPISLHALWRLLYHILTTIHSYMYIYIYTILPYLTFTLTTPTLALFTARAIHPATHYYAHTLGLDPKPHTHTLTPGNQTGWGARRSWPFWQSLAPPVSSRRLCYPLGVPPPWHESVATAVVGACTRHP